MNYATLQSLLPPACILSLKMGHENRFGKPNMVFITPGVHGYFYGLLQAWGLNDLRHGPSEMDKLIINPGYRQIANQLRVS